MKTYEQFLNEVMPYVPGCQTNIAVHHIRNAAIEFCEKTLILQTDLDPVSVTVGINDYDLEAPTGYVVCKIMKAFYNNTPLVQAAPDEIRTIDAYNPSATDAPGRGTPRWIFQKDERSFSVLPVPKETKALAVNIRAALKPTRSSTGIDDNVYEDYFEVIANGAKARLMVIPNTTYTNPQMAGVCKALFDQGVNLARIRANKGHGRGNLSVKIQRI